MERHLPSLLLLAAALLASNSSSAQGCSDAGVCTAGPIGELYVATDSLATGTEPRHMVRLSYSYAIGERGVMVQQIVPELAWGFTERWGVQVKVPYMSASGHLGSNSGLSDPTLTTSYAFIAERERRLQAVAGVKIPVGDANALADNSSTAQMTRSLPMPYQTSLGTTDLLLGLAYRHKRITTTLAYQHVLANNNRNGFRHSAWMDDMDALGYFESWELVRANDAVARIQYAIPIGKLAVQPGLLAIYHTAKDQRLEALPTENGGILEPRLVAVDGSEGPTLNLTLDARYRFNALWALELAYGSPLLVRSERPDGLTRSMVLSIGLAHRFGK
jgi:hypothetical protein